MSVVGEQLARGLGACAQGDQIGEIGESAQQVDARHDLQRGDVRRIEH